MEYILILAAGLAAGFINTVAGGGSLITLPILIFMGLPSATANGTNRIALMAQNISAIANFKRKGFFYPKLVFLLGLPAIIGSIIGSNIAVNLPDEIFNKTLGIVMIFVLILIVIRPEKKFLKNHEFEELIGKRKIISLIVFFFIGIYGGFIQAGVGFILIVSLSLITGLSLVKINSIKVAIIAMYTVSALIIFIINGNVDWGLGILLAIGNSTGAYLGSNFSVKKGDKYIQAVITIAVVVMAGKLWGFWL
jgi:uncharacterized membrane protein YfcA